MKTIKILLIMIFLPSILYSDINKDLHIGIAVYKFSEEYKKKIKAVVDKSLIMKGEDYEIKSYPTFIDKRKQELDEFSKFQKINMVFTYPSIYLKNREFFRTNSKEIVVLAEKNSFTQYYLIANKESNIRSINDLEDKRFITFRGNENYLIWLDYLTLSRLGKPYKKIIKNEESVIKDHTLVLDVFFKKRDFSVVAKNVYEDILQLNPALEKKITIIEKSKPIFVYGIGFIHKKTSPELVKKINDFLVGEGANKRFKYLMDFIDRDTIKVIEYKNLKELEKFYDEYMKLKNTFY